MGLPRCVRVDERDSRSRKALAEDGWREIEVLETFRGDTREIEDNPGVRPYKGEDFKGLLSIVRQTGGASRLFKDSRVGEVAALAARIDWFESYVDREDVWILVAGKCAGFCAVSQTTDVARIEMIAVAEQGKGHGHRLVRAALDSRHGLTVALFAGTQSDNRIARLLYESAGMKRWYSEVTFHK